MKTKILELKTHTLEEIAATASVVLKNGGLVVFPTETVYGIGANALDKDAASKIYMVKGRPSDNPLIVHLSSSDQISLYAKADHPYLKLLTNAFWPGPLTIVLPKKDNIPSEITGGLQTVALRSPSHPIAQAILQKSQLPVCAPSANISGTPSSTSFSHVLDDLNSAVDIIINGGESTVGLESTVLDLTSDVPIILRPGSITKEMLEECIQSPVLLSDSTQKVKDIPKAPGMKYKHYSPKGDAFILKGSHEQIISFFKQTPKEAALIACTNIVSKIDNRITFDLGYENDLETIAKYIFHALREMDRMNVPTIYIQSFPNKGLGVAIMNRLKKAANNKIITL
jgi:L-threonylcarbamoyladenylate synthase